MEAFLEIAKSFGVPVALLAFILWKDWRKEQRENRKEDDLITRVESMEEFQRTTLTTMVAESTIALNSSTKVMDKLSESNERLVKRLETRPCLKVIE